MRTIIAGSRSITDMAKLLEAIAACGWIPSVVICGMAAGADSLGLRWALTGNIPVERFYPDWRTHGKSAGFIRNVDMAHHAEALIALWNGESRGTKHMIEIANKQGLKVYVHRV